MGGNKFIKKQKKKVSVSEKIADLYTVKPRPDIEDDLVFNTKPVIVSKDDIDSDSDGAEGKVILSDFRKRNAALLADISDKYAGKVGSKNVSDDESDGSDVDRAESDAEEAFDDDKDMEGSVEEEEEESDKGNEFIDDEAEEASDDNDKEDSVDDEEDKEGSVDDEEDMEGSVDEEDNYDEDDDGLDLSQADNKKEETFVHMKEINVEEEINKGKCVKNQLSIWEKLLEMRIALQKCLICSNKMPLPDKHKELKKDQDFASSANRAKNSVSILLDKMLELQSSLWKQYPETKKILKKDKSIKETDDVDDEEIPSDVESNDEEEETTARPIIGKKRKLSDFDDCLSDRHSSFAKYRNGIIQKWHEKTRLTVANSKNKVPQVSTLSQIEYLLKDKQRLIRRTQLKKSKYEIVGENVKNKDEVAESSGRGVINSHDNEFCPEIFDDDDFYHQLLRELIEYKSADVSDPIQLSRQWIALQQMRSKMKRKIDTKATKGRRIKYVVHPKMVNYAAPRKNLDWTDEMRDELFASLFGKNFSS